METPAVVDLSINQLPPAQSLDKQGLGVVYQNGETQSYTMAQLISTANVETAEQVELALNSAEQAKASETSAAGSAQSAAASKDAAQTAQENAESAKQAAEESKSAAADSAAAAAESAQQAAGAVTGVISFNGRQGTVTPEQGDYTPDQVGAADKTLSNLTDYQKALFNIGGRPNRNLLDNWYFVGGGSQKGYGYFPINQNGKTNYTTQQEIPLTIDRWFADWNISLDVTDAGLVISGGGIFQYLENDVINCIQNKQITLSAFFQDGSLVTVTGNSSESFEKDGISYLLQYGNGYNAVRIIGNAIAAKLEVGTKQTLAYQDSSGAWQLFEKPAKTTNQART